jgi:hypothetical protein
MNTEEKLKELELEIEEIKKDIRTKTESPRGFIAVGEKDATHFLLKVHLCCRALSTKVIAEEYYEGCYKQIYNTKCYCERTKETKEKPIEAIFSGDNKIIGCTPFKLTVGEETSVYKYEKTITDII